MVECKDTFEFKKLKDMSSYIINTEDSRMQDFFIANDMHFLFEKNQVEEILNKRKEMMQLDERRFVESLGLEYVD